VLAQNLSADLFAQKYFRFFVVVKMPLELDDIEVEMIERSAHTVKPVLRFDDELMVAVGMSPFFLLFSQRAVMSVAAPLFPRSADPAVEDFPVGKFDNIAELIDEFRKFKIGFRSFQFVTDLVGDRNQNTVIIRGGRHRQQDQVLALLETLDNFLGSLFPAKLRKTFLDVLDLKRSGLERVLTDDMFHSVKYSSGLRLEPFIKDGNITRCQREMDCGTDASDDLQLHLLTIPGNLFDILDIPIHRFAK